MPEVRARMRIVGVIQARASSRRLPGKILRPLCGRPILDHLLEGLAHAKELDALVLATSDDSTDDATERFARDRQVACFRGPLDDVALRMLRAGESQRADAIVRINGDSPLLDPALVDRGVALFRESGVDIVTNVRPRSFPKGQSVEVVSMVAMRRAVGSMTMPDEREHVTPFIYAHPETFSLRAFVADEPRPEMQLSIDDPADFDQCGAVLSALPGPPWRVGWKACVAEYDRCSAAARAGAAR